MLAVEASYERFAALRAPASMGTSEADLATSLLQAAMALGEGPVAVVAIDMPTGAAVHSPSRTRPGLYGKQIAQAFGREGYRLATTQVSRTTLHSLVEVFPLASLVRLMRLSKRPAYKVRKAARYWPNASSEERRNRLAASFAALMEALEKQIDIPDLLAAAGKGARFLKSPKNKGRGWA
jgi:hypothetical protein